MVYRITGEARVCTVGPKFAILSKPGLDGTIFVQPTSLTIACPDNPLPSLPDHLRHNDVCVFEAEAQAERNGSKWRAIDGSVKVIRQAETINGDGTITKLDETNGQFGFIRSPIGDVFFNASSVRPVAKNITTVLKAGQSVRFTAIKGAAQQRNNTVQLRAVMVCARNYRPLNDVSAAVRPTLRESNLTKACLKSTTSDTVALNSGTRDSIARTFNTSPTENAWLKRPQIEKTPTESHDSGINETPPATESTKSFGFSSVVGKQRAPGYNVWTGRSLVSGALSAPLMPTSRTSTDTLATTSTDDSKISPTMRAHNDSVVSSERSTVNSPLSSAPEDDKADNIFTSLRQDIDVAPNGMCDSPKEAFDATITASRPLDKLISEPNPYDWLTTFNDVVTTPEAKPYDNNNELACFGSGGVFDTPLSLQQSTWQREVAQRPSYTPTLSSSVVEQRYAAIAGKPTFGTASSAVSPLRSDPVWSPQQPLGVPTWSAPPHFTFDPSLGQ